MPNNIPIQQNAAGFIDHIAASSEAYGWAKKLATFQSGIALLAAALGPLFALAWPEQRAWAALFGVSVLLVDFMFLEPHINSSRECGAKIQEDFDTQLFQLPWNNTLCAQIQQGVIATLAHKFKRKNSTERHVDWYAPCVGAVPIDYARLICQASNLQWDAALRRKYSMVFVITLVALAIGATAFALIRDMKAEEIILSIVVPLLPASIKLLRERSKHESSAKGSEHSIGKLQSIWTEAMKPSTTSPPSANESRKLQDLIYTRRASSPTVPSFFHGWFREQLEMTMVTDAQTMVTEVQAKLAPPASGS